MLVYQRVFEVDSTDVVMSSPLQTSQVLRLEWSKGPAGAPPGSLSTIKQLKCTTGKVKVCQGLYPSRNHFLGRNVSKCGFSTAACSWEGSHFGYTCFIRYGMGGLGPNVWVWLLVKSHYLQVQHGSLGPERVNGVKPFITKITILWVLAIPSHGRFMARVRESQGSWKQMVFPPGKNSFCLVISPKSYSSCFIQNQNGLMIQHHFEILQGWVVQAPSAVTLAGLGQHVEDWNCLWGSSSCTGPERCTHRTWWVMELSHHALWIQVPS